MDRSLVYDMILKNVEDEDKAFTLQMLDEMSDEEVAEIVHNEM